MNRFQKTLAKKNDGRPPVWLMRQAGRYHSHYQALRKQHSFMDLCKLPEVAAEVAMGPIQDFDFDAAILFSDLLFPLEVMGMPLEYSPGPKLGWHLRSKTDLSKLSSKPGLAQQLDFQAKAMRLTRSRLSPEKGLLGFVGGPLTLFFYAVEGSHQKMGDPIPESQTAVAGLTDGRYDGFCEKLLPLLADNMVLQAQAGADTVAILDTCGGEVSPAQFRDHVAPVLKELLKLFHQKLPNYPVTYYSKKTGPEYWEFLRPLQIEAMGIDWNHDIAQVLERWSDRFVIQGNVDPDWMLLPKMELEPKLRHVFQSVHKLPQKFRRGWICGLGHGVLQTTPEENVRLFVQLEREIFGK
ncbi:uroporphyrinogen decarboxylase [bacterium]|jgi:uroporphyrinogen decarboxylase|nr:uroporphyrinogen decarboxylase [bacterium]